MKLEDIDYRELIAFALNEKDQLVDLTKVREWLAERKCKKHYDIVVDVIKDLGYNCNRKLKVSWTIDAQQDLTSSIDLDLEKIMAEIVDDIDAVIINDINAAIIK